MQTKKKGVSHTPWEKIKNEYLTTGATMRALSRKYHLAVSTISSRAKKEGWQKIQQEITYKVSDKIEQKIVDTRVSNTDKAMQILNTLMDKINEAVNEVNPKDTGAIKTLVASMKDLKELAVFETESKEDVVIVRFEGGEDYAD